MNRFQKLLLIFFFLLTITVLIELSYYLFIAQNISKPSPKANMITSSVNPTSFNKNSGSLNKYITELKTYSQTPTNLLDRLQSLIPFKCKITDNCFEYNNPDKSWLTRIATNSAVTVNEPFAIKVSQQNTGNLSGVLLYGRLQPHDTDSWWKGIIALFIGVDYKNNLLYLDIKNGQSKKPITLLDKSYPPLSRVLYFIFDNNGKNILVTDEAYNQLATIDINQITNNMFPQGIFPDNKFYVGFSTNANSSIRIYNLSVMPL